MKCRCQFFVDCDTSEYEGIPNCTTSIWFWDEEKLYVELGVFDVVQLEFGYYPKHTPNTNKNHKVNDADHSQMWIQTNGWYCFNHPVSYGFNILLHFPFFITIIIIIIIAIIKWLKFIRPQNGIHLPCLVKQPTYQRTCLERVATGNTSWRPSLGNEKRWSRN